jgi:hypothetical protein
VRRALRSTIAIGCSISVLCCRKADERAAEPAPPSDAAIAARSGPVPARSGIDWAELVGRCVVAEGYSGGGAKTGASLDGGSWSIGLIVASASERTWLELAPGALVRARGVVAVRADRPVFVQKPGEPVMQGIPVPEGTDLESARRRHVIEQATITPLRTAAQVDAALRAEIGKRVSLPGVVWSVNGRYWFNHDGLAIHVTGQEAFDEWSSLHGKAVVLSGRLERRKLPRIDQYVLKPNPDLADSFVIVLQKIAAHPGSPISPCAE